MDKQEYRAIKTWAEEDRPREKLLNRGRTALTDAELMAILLGSGSPRESAVDLAKRLLHSVDYNLNALGRLSVEELMHFKGIGEAKGIAIITALEIGKRRRLEEALHRKRLTCSLDSYNVLQPLIGDLDHEEFWVLFLNRRNELLGRECISQGGLAGTVADSRLIFRQAVLNKATAIILAHNHPSGNPKPSSTDIRLTGKLVQSGQIMDIAVLDHLIVCEKEYTSLADEGEL